MDYEASAGKEILLSFEDERETLFGLLRMRIQSKSPLALGNTSGNIALIRELHVFGPEVALSQQDPTSAQHKGFGRLLLAEAERIAGTEFRAPQMAILSGIGAKEYYRELDYTSQGAYMVKSLSSVPAINHA